MKKVWIQSATLIDSQLKSYPNTDVLVVDGKIAAIGKDLSVPADAEIIEADGSILAPGFCDLNVNAGEPGFETKEDLHSLARAAFAGGITALALQPNTNPPLHSKAQISYICSTAADLPVAIYPLGTISHERKGEALAELFDMYQAGALAFTDGDKPLAHAGVMSRALLYTKGFGARIFSYAEDASVAANAMVNEGFVSTYLGLKGNPALAEELMISRDIELAAYNQSPIHFSTISSAKSVQLIREAKAKGIAVTCDVAAHHLILTEEALLGFDSNYKVKPPLRTEEDRNALLAGLADDTIDAVVSQHTPHEIEFKALEFGLAAYGIIGLQTLLPLALKAGLTTRDIIKKLALEPRKILGLALPKIAEGEAADLVLFDPKAKWVFDEQTNASKSANSPFMGYEFTGKVRWACANNQYYTSKN
jgi:dihydroorotase